MRSSLLLPMTRRLRDILQLRFTAIFAGMSPAALESISPTNPLKRLARVGAYAAGRPPAPTGAQAG